MFDGLYQSIICFFMGYLLFAPANFVTSNGLGVNDRPRVGVYIACAVIVVVNVYILMNSYRWDWLMLLLVSISVLLIWFWTGVYTSFSAVGEFYQAATEVYGQLTFWALTLLTISVCLLPRFVFKAAQKIYLPRDIDIIREQVRLGKFDYLDHDKKRFLPIKSRPLLPRKFPSQRSRRKRASQQCPRTRGQFILRL